MKKKTKTNTNPLSNKSSSVKYIREKSKEKSKEKIISPNPNIEIITSSHFRKIIESKTITTSISPSQKLKKQTKPEMMTYNNSFKGEQYPIKYDEIKFGSPQSKKPNQSLKSSKTSSKLITSSSPSKSKLNGNKSDNQNLSNKKKLNPNRTMSELNSGINLKRNLSPNGGGSFYGSGNGNSMIQNKSKSKAKIKSLLMQKNSNQNENKNENDYDNNLPFDYNDPEAIEKFLIKEDPNKYGFNLWLHMKRNLQNIEKLCKDELSKNSYYCIDCKLSVCTKCPDFESHKDHKLINTYLYYVCDEKTIQDSFLPIDELFKEHSTWFNPQTMKNELKELVIKNFDELINQLNDIKQSKIKEIDKLFQNSIDRTQELDDKRNQLKNDIKEFFNQQKSFFCINIEDQNKENGNKNENEDKVKSNKDKYNTIFLSSYDLLENTKYMNNEIKQIVDTLQENKNNYINFFNDKVKEVKKNLELLTHKVKDDFDFNSFNKDFYRIIHVKIKKYYDKINSMKKYIYDRVNKKGNFDDIDKNNKDSETQVTQKFENVLNYQLIDKEEANNLKSKLKGKYSRLQNNNFNILAGASKKILNIINNMNFINNNNNSNNGGTIEAGNLSQTLLSKAGENGNNSNAVANVYNSPDEIKLDKDVLQKFFAYELYKILNKVKKSQKKLITSSPSFNLSSSDVNSNSSISYKDNNKLRNKKSSVGKSFIKDKNINGNENEKEELSLDEEIELAKPIPGTSEIQLYDKRTNTMVRKFVKFDKSKFKYSNFLLGCRSVLIKEILYIFGGVDKESKITNVAYAYHIKTNKLKLLPEMIFPHCYHSVEFLDFYKSIVVLGGENSGKCELYDMREKMWRALPEMNVPRAHCNLYLDKYSHTIFSFFGVIGKFANNKNIYTDVIEFLELKKLALGWNKIDYENKAEMDFKAGYNKIFPLNNEMILVYGATNMRNFVKKAAVFLINKEEMVKIDNRIFRELKEKSKSSKKLDKILSAYI